MSETLGGISIGLFFSAMVLASMPLFFAGVVVFVVSLILN